MVGPVWGELGPVSRALLLGDEDLHRMAVVTGRGDIRTRQHGRRPDLTNLGSGRARSFRSCYQGERSFEGLATRRSGGSRGPPRGG